MITQTDYDPSMWLWVIHDMVNQKLGKICISYEKLKTRHDVVKHLVSDFVVMDIMILLLIGSNANIKPKTTDFMRIIMRLLKQCNPIFFKLPTLFEAHMRNASFRSSNDKRVLSMDDMFQLHQALYTAYGLPTTSRSDFDAQYKLAIVEPNTSAQNK